MKTNCKIGFMGWALGASLAFNLAFLGSVVWGHLARESTTNGQESSSQQRPDPRLLSQLNLSAAQRAGVEQHRTEAADRIAGLRKEVSEARSALWRLVAGGTAGPAELTAGLDRITAAQRGIQEQVVDYMIWLRSQLTSDQAARFDAVVVERMCTCPACDGGCIGGCRHGGGASPVFGPQKAEAGCGGCADEGNDHGGTPCGCGGGTMPFDKEVLR